MHRQPPFGVYEGSSREEGSAPYGGAERPGPLGVDGDDAHGRSAWDSASPLQPGGSSAGGSVSFTLGTGSYRLLRLDTEWRQRFDEVRVPPEEAAAVIEEAAKQHHDSHDLALLFEAAASQLAGLHEDGVFVLLQRQSHHGQVMGSVSTAPASTPSALRPPALPDTPSPLLEDPEFGLEQAAVLKDAAVAGIPFCEECARLAAQRGS